MLELIRSGKAFTEPATAERLTVHLVGALMCLHHRVDRRGRRSVYWPIPGTWWRPWPRRSTYTVHEALSAYLRQPDVYAGISGYGFNPQGPL